MYQISKETEVTQLLNNLTLNGCNFAAAVEGCVGNGLKRKFNLTHFVYQVDGWMLLKITEKMIRRNVFEQKKAPDFYSADRSSND